MSHAWQSYAVYEAITLKSPKPSCVYETFAPAAQATCNSQRQQRLHLKLTLSTDNCVCVCVRECVCHAFKLMREV